MFNCRIFEREVGLERQQGRYLSFCSRVTRRARLKLGHTSASYQTVYCAPLEV